MTDVIDLDALQPKPAVIRFNGREITLNPPKTGDILKLGEVSQKLENLATQSSDEINTTVEEVTTQIYNIIPELNGEPLSTSQLLVLIKAISEMAIPPDSKELKARGITVDSDPKAK